jgi:2-methylisocitrate lyase-like PEP mutase family enzyme
MSSQIERGVRFRQMHEGPATFLIPNPWDAGSARLLEGAGFEALATTSAGHAFSLGRADGRADRGDVLDHVATIAAATSLPVSADMEDCFGGTPDDVAATVTAVADRGAVGCSIEDRRRTGELYDLGDAVARVAAAVAAARALDFPFTLTARCEYFVAGRPDLDGAIERLRAFQEAGADVLYAPGLTTPDQIQAVVTSVDRPVNVVAGLSGESLSVGQLQELGVRRISLGSTLARVAYGALLRAAEEMHEAGTFGFATEATPFARMNSLMGR